MIKINSITKRISSGQKSRFLAMPQMLHRVVAMFILAFVCTGAWAATNYAKVKTEVNPSSAGTAYVSTTATIGTDTEAEQKSNTNNGYVTFYVKATAAAGSGYTFDHWEFTSAEGETKITERTDAETSIEVQVGRGNGTLNYTICAVFTLKYYFSVQAFAGTGGTVSPSAAQKYNSFTNTTTTGTFTATPNSGYAFVNWTKIGSSEVVSTNASTTFNVSSSSTVESNPTVTEFQANFKKLNVYNFAANAIVKPSTAYGTATATVEESSISTLDASASTTATFKVTSVNDGYYWIGWNETEDGTTTTEQTVTATLNNSTDGSTVTKTMYAIFGKCADPTSVSANNFEVATGTTYTIPVTLAPSNAYRKLEFASSNEAIATVDANGIVTGVSTGQTTITIKAYKVGSTDFVSTTITATVKEKVATPVISFTPTPGDMGETATASITCTTEGATIYYTINGDTPTSTSTQYNGTFTVNNLDVVKAIAIKDGYYIDSEIATAIYSKHKVATPTINISNGQVSFSCNEDGEVTYYYTTDGSAPTTSSTLYTGPFTPTLDECTIKVIATMVGSQNSDVAERPYVVQSGIKGNTVILNDYEDHNWAYYKGLTNDDGTPKDDGTYNTTYKGKMYSPDPRNVKITYKGGSVDGASAVAISRESNENQNEMVYYKTLEKFIIGEFTDTNNDGVPDNYNNQNEWYPYTIIPNPFSKRPKLGTTYYGFAGWKVTKGWANIKRADGTTATQNSVLNLDEKIHFIGLDKDINGNDYAPNCTSAEIEFEATWKAATVHEGNSAYSFTGGDYETNFLVINTNTTTAITQSSPCTIMGIYPDGTGTMYSINGVTAGTENVKVEWVNSGTGNWNANGHNFTIGRGVTTNSTGANQSTYSGVNDEGNCENVVRIESGTYGRVYIFRNGGANSGSRLNNLTIFGCDYDRARAHPENEDDPYTNNLVLRQVDVSGTSGSTTLYRNPGQLYWRGVFKSGKHIGGDDLASSTSYTAKSSQQFYCGAHSNIGQRFLLIEGGRINGVTGGSDGDGTYQNGKRAFTIRMKGNACVLGCIVGAASSNPGSGDRAFAITGGKIGGWIAAGANGTSDNGGTTIGNSYIYIGGNANLDSKQFYTPHTLNHSFGGIVYGAGCGMTAGYDSGSMEESTNVVLADNGYVERAIYGGGAYGQAANVSGDSPVNNVPANIYILGGHLGGVDGTDDTGNVSLVGGVFGGASQNNGCSSNIYMYGGLVEGGIHGGSNASGNMNYNTNIYIYGGQVGTDSETANVHGGGFGQTTTVNGNVDVTIGKENATEGAMIYGDVYGGSALGSVNDATTDHTNVTLNAGTINGSLYGGALGSETIAANVYGPVQVTVNGGSVNTTSAVGSGAVYGCNNLNGAPQSTVKVDIYGTDPAPAENQYALDAVYGGGNMANYSAGTPEVTVHNCDNSIGTVYGGGNAADITGTGHGTNVTIYGGNVIGKVFGGGNGEREDTEANISGGTNVTIHGGTILEVYGGSNTRGTIGGAINVTVNEKAEKAGEEACPTNINNVFGGGNLASSAAANMTIGCASHIGAVYGGANQADITSGNIDLTIAGGNIDNVFGGNNISGTISGTIKVTVNEDKTTYPCGMEVGNVYGAGNQAAYTNAGAYPEVNILNGKITGNVFGGGLGETAVVTSNPVVLINGGTVQGNVFGGGSEANTVGNPVVTMQAGSVGDALYGGGALANVTGNTTVSLTGGTVNNVYGGGLGDASTAALINGGTNVTLNGSVVTGSIFGCNNVNGTPQGHVRVLVQKTTAQPGADEDAYHVAAVYGGGNQAAYIPTSDTDFTEVEVLTCDNSIEYVYGGGNAASTPKTQVTINGGRMFNVFGGGNGAGTGNPGADVGYKNHNISETYGEGTTNVNIYGGTITSVFGGSNTLGNIRVASNVNLDDAGTCTFDVGDVYGAGNEAEMYGNGNLIIGCIPGLNEIYGGAKNADIHGDVSLTIRNGKFGKVFGGNNLGGNINGSITVNIEETGCRPIEIGELYGGGNLAAYTAPAKKTMYPEVNIKSFTSIGTVYGGGLGVPANELELITDEAERAAAKAKGVVKGNPHVNIGLVEGKFANGGTYGDEPNEEVFPAISNKWGNKLGTIGDVYGGGNAADVDGDTYVNIATTDTVTLTTGDNKDSQPLKGANISGNVYGGGNAAHVTGKTHVQVGKAP